VLHQWVQTRQITSKEKSDGRLEQAILTDTHTHTRTHTRTHKSLSNELTLLYVKLEELENSTTEADEDRAELTALKEAIVTTLPTPLVNRIKPLIRRLPDDPANTKLSLGERVQNIVGILSQADKFNTTITQTSESRELDSGTVVEVRTLYWGLAMAYYVDAAGEYAGIGFLGKDGWEWPQIDGAGPQIKKRLDVYEGSEEIQFVEVPARIN
jgi:hypothetical protein